MSDANQQASARSFRGWRTGLVGHGPVSWFSFSLMLLWVTVAFGASAEWEAGPGYRSRGLTLVPPARLLLNRLAASTTGIQFTNRVSEQRGLENSLRTSGSGVAAGDVNGDGWCDLYFCGMDNQNALYRNLGGGRFEETTAAAGVACAGQDSTGAVFADVDGDGDLDLLVNALGQGTRLFLNDGKGRFAEAKESGLIRRFGATSLALADIDGNGSLDLYVANYSATKIEDRPNARFETKRVDGKIVITAIDGVLTSSPELTNRYFVDAERVVREAGEADILYLNDGRGKFQPVSWTDGSFLDETGRPLASPPLDFGLSVMFRDLNGDRVPDIYVCNDLFPPDRLWINDGRGRFRAMSNLAVRHTCRFAMGVDFADINRDGWDDFFVVDMLSRMHPMRKTQTSGVTPTFLPVGLIDYRPQYKHNTLFLGRGDGTYAEIAQLAGLEATEWSWMPVFLDVDLDGYEDVLVTTGYARDSLNADAVAQILKERGGRRLTDAEHRALKKKHYPPLDLHNQAFRNRGDLTFEDKAAEWGFNYKGQSHGMCLADLDNDGDLDVIVNHLNDVAGIYRFESAAPRVAVRLKGLPPNTSGIGGRILVRGGPVPQSQEILGGGRYLAGDDAVRMFATGQATGNMTIEVLWRSGASSVVRDVRPNRLYEIDEAGASRTTTSGPALSGDNPWFKDSSHSIQHTHVDAPFADFERQPLLTRRLSQLGPGVTWADVNGDGWEDLTVGSGAGGHLAIHLGDGAGGFKKVEAPVVNEQVRRDQTTILPWHRPDGSTSLLVGSSNYEDARPGGGMVQEYSISGASPTSGFPGWEISLGPMAMADVDADGQLDLFVGGRVEPGRYPDAVSSLLFRGTGGKFEPHAENCRALALSGLISGAVFSDLDGDGDPDLVLATEWGPLKVFRNDRGRIAPWSWRVVSATGSLTNLSQLTGWWNGVTTGDFDGDGRLDIVASNWGRNSRYQAHRQRPMQVHYGEWTVPGVVDVLEGYYDTGLNKWVPWAAYRVAKLIPWIAERFDSQTAYSTVGIGDLLGERMRAAKVIEASWLESTVFLNRRDHFEARVLPIEAQFAPAFAVCVADLNGDGREDLFLSQNFFAVDGETSRYDAGRGLWLAGDGKGGFRPVPGQESGLAIYGEQRGAAVCDYDADGRVDLAVSQNGAETKLYRNTRARPGLRVRMSGLSGNPAGVGVVLQLESDGQAGPAREIHAGSGYWSHDGAVQVLCSPTAGTRLRARWPGGKTTTTVIPPGAREITVDPTGSVVRSR